MYWPNEGSVSTVERASIDETTMEVGKQCTVQHKYNGMVAAQGNTLYTHFKNHSKHITGTKSDMEKLEDNFVNKTWSPSFLNTNEPPKKKKRKNILNTNETPKKKKRKNKSKTEDKQDKQAKDKPTKEKKKKEKGTKFNI